MRPAFVTTIASAVAGFLVLVGGAVAVEQRSARDTQSAPGSPAAVTFPESALRAGATVQLQAGARAPSSHHAFYFTRGIYSDFRGGRAWWTDYPKADIQLLTVLRRWPPVSWLFSAPRPLAAFRKWLARETAPVSGGGA